MRIASVFYSILLITSICMLVLFSPVQGCAEDLVKKYEFDGKSSGLTLRVRYAELDDVIRIQLINVSKNPIRIANNIHLSIIEWKDESQVVIHSKMNDEIKINSISENKMNPGENATLFRGKISEKEGWSNVEGVVQFLARYGNSGDVFISNPIRLNSENNTAKENKQELGGDETIVNFSEEELFDLVSQREYDAIHKRWTKEKDINERLRDETRRNMRELIMAMHFHHKYKGCYPNELTELYGNGHGTWNEKASYRSPARSHSEELIVDYGMADLNKAEPDAFTVVLWDKPGNWPDGGYVAFYNGMRKFIAVEKDTWREIEEALTTRKGKEIIKKHIPEANVDDFED